MESVQFSDYFYFDNDTVIKGSGENEIFGISVESADINRDGFDDLIIGAPNHGKDSNGAVFVYFGSNEGIKVDNVQKIEGKGTSGFGQKIAVSDFDENGYTDVIIASGEPKPKVFAYHSRPSIDIEFQIRHPFHLQNVSEHDQQAHDILYLPESDNKQEVIQICVSYTGVALPEVLQVKSHVSLDVDFDSIQNSLRRLIVPNETIHDHTANLHHDLVVSPNGTYFEHGHFLKKGETSCEDVEMIIQTKKFLTIKDILIIGRVDIENSTNFIGQLKPIINPRSNYETELEISIFKDCGDDNICESRIT